MQRSCLSSVIARRKDCGELSPGGQPRAKAWECRPALESQQAVETSTPSIALNQKQIFRFGGGEIRADVGGRALGGRRRHCVGSRDLAPLDVAGRAMEPPTEAQETLPTQGTQIALWRTGAAGRQFP